MIQIAYAIWNYSKTYYIYTGISMVSVMEHTKAEICFHILHDETLDEREQAEMRSLCAKWDQRIVFHFVRLDERLSRRDLYGSGYGDGIFFRIYLPSLLPKETKVIYLDSDIIAEMDIESLWRTDLRGHLAGAVWDPPRRGFPAKCFYDREQMQPFIDRIDWNAYFNSGVMLMDLDKIRKAHDLVEETVGFFERFPMRLPDQDALNFILHGQVELLDSEYNTFTYILEKPRKNAILHYSKCSFGAEYLDEFDQIVLSYWKRSVWFNASLPVTAQVQMLSDMKSPKYVKEKIIETGIDDWSEESWRETAEKWKNQESLIPVNQEERFSRGLCRFKEKQYTQAIEAFEQCLYYGTDEANWIALRSLYMLTKCAFVQKKWKLAEKYNRMAGVLSPESEPYKVNRLLIDWKRQNQSGQKSEELC